MTASQRPLPPGVPLQRTAGEDTAEPVFKGSQASSELLLFFPLFRLVPVKPVILKVFSLRPIDTQITEDPKGFSLCEFYLPIFIVLEIKTENILNINSFKMNYNNEPRT